MTRFRKKPVEIEARMYPGQFVKNLDDLLSFEEWLEPLARAAGCWPLRYSGQSLIIPTLEGNMTASPGDYVICGVRGELYPCKPGIFAETYEPVE